MTDGVDNAAYNRGFRAGRKKTEAEIAQAAAAAEAMRSERQAAWWKVYSAALQGLLAGGGSWKIGKVKVADVTTYSALARQFADEAMKSRPTP